MTNYHRLAPFSIFAMSAMCSVHAAHAQRAYVSASGCGAPLGDEHFYILDLQTGDMENLGLKATCIIEGLAVAPGGRVLGYTETNADPRRQNPDMGLWDLSTLPGVKIGGDGLRPGVDSGLSFDPTTGNLYSLQGADFLFGITWSWLYQVDPQSGAATLVGEDTEIYVDSLAINSKGEAFAVDMVFDQMLYSVDLATGDLTAIAPVVGGQPNLQCALAFDSLDNLWLVQSGNALRPGETFILDTQTGVANYVTDIEPILASFPGAWYNSLAIIPEGCYADCDQSTGPGVLDIFDFLCFQSAFVSGDPFACDCDLTTGSAACDIFDFLCFQSAFVNGCP